MLKIVNENIVTISADVIVNSANKSLKMGGGVCGEIFKAAGEKELTEACQKIGFCETGEVAVTSGFRLCEYIFHVSAVKVKHFYLQKDFSLLDKLAMFLHPAKPIWYLQCGGYSPTQEDEKLLKKCYSNPLTIAKNRDCKSIAFPLISSEIYNYPYYEALNIAKKTITKWLDENDDCLTVWLCDFHK